MTAIRPYLVIPNLILQPTWGGQYIASFKQLHHPKLDGQNIGQSYELYEHTNLSSLNNTNTQPLFEIGDPNTPQNTVVFSEDNPINIKELIQESPEKTLGTKTIAIHGAKMGVLIKFTQAKGNSYQLHVKQDTDAWQTKPESWYYFEPGYLTLGVKPNIDWQQYQTACQELYALSLQLSQAIKAGQLHHSQAQEQMQQAIENHKIQDFVNVVVTTKNEAIDLSACGVHHSWEEDDQKFPLGNVLYEVQKNSFDPDSTIRSFDKGKFQPDGSIRKLQIEDYFKYIDRSPQANNPNTYQVKTKALANQKNFSVSQIFYNQYYQMREIRFSGIFENRYTKTADSFHHLFARSGSFALESHEGKLSIKQGSSVFIPASTGQYQLTTDHHAVVLQTFV